MRTKQKVSVHCLRFCDVVEASVDEQNVTISVTLVSFFFSLTASPYSPPL